jgi:hypothetical protein
LPIACHSAKKRCFSSGSPAAAWSAAPSTALYQRRSSRKHGRFSNVFRTIRTCSMRSPESDGSLTSTDTTNIEALPHCAYLPKSTRKKFPSGRSVVADTGGRPRVERVWLPRAERMYRSSARWKVDTAKRRIAPENVQRLRAR